MMRKLMRPHLSRRWAFAGAVAAGLLSSGCAHEWFVDKKACRDERCQILEKGAIPQPNGTFTRAFLTTQAGRAEVDDFVVYRYEWLDDSAKLNDYGERHLMNVARRLQDGPALVLIEDCGNRELNQQRTVAVISYLASHGVADAPNRVAVGTPEAEGLYGEEMPGAFGQLIIGNSLNGGRNTGFNGRFGAGGSNFFGGLGGALGGIGGVFGGVR